MAVDGSSVKHVLKKIWVQNVIAALAAFYVRLIYLTCSWQKKGFEIPERYLKEKKPFITCFWHARLLLLPYAWPGEKKTFYMLISAHKDGRIISKTVAPFGIQTVEGSTKKKGTAALLNMVRLSRAGFVLGITPDGPRGPSGEVSDGTIMAAYLAKADLIPVTYAVKRHKRLSSWDRFFLPFPFSKGVLMWGQPVAYPANKKDLGRTQHQLKRAMDQLVHQADAAVGI